MIHIWKNKGTNVSSEFLETFKGHKGVKEKTFEDPYSDISSFNFTRNVFWDRTWDDVVVKARGMFVNNATIEVAARGYNKFFNIGETEETQSRSLCENLQFPVEVFVKENGFLGLVGLNGDNLLITSKGTPEGPFAVLFRKIFDHQISKEKQEEILAFIKDEEACLVCEVIDPNEDPHIIDHKEPHIVLLDIFHRNTEMERVPFKSLQKQAEAWGMKCKKHFKTFQEWQDFWSFYKRIEEFDCKIDNEFIEGFVLEDTSGFMTKIKLPHYNFWKRMRSIKDRVLKVRGTKRSLQRNIDDPEAKEFYEWCLKQSDKSLQLSIIDLRNKFLKEGQARYLELARIAACSALAFADDLATGLSVIAEALQENDDSVLYLLKESKKDIENFNTFLVLMLEFVEKDSPLFKELGLYQKNIMAVLEGDFASAINLVKIGEVLENDFIPCIIGYRQLDTSVQEALRKL